MINRVGTPEVQLAEHARAWTLAVGWGVTAYSVHKVGTLVGWYLQYDWFQHLTHAASASGVAALLVVAGLSIGYRGPPLVGFVVGLALAGAVGWEVVEYLNLLDAYGIWLHFHDFGDASVDMLFNLLGIAGTLVVVRSVRGFD